MTTYPDEQVDIKFKAAWSVFAQTCGHFWAPEASYQAWFAHYLISQFGIDRVAREPKIHTKLFTSPLKARYKNGEAEPDAVITRRPGITMPHYANRLGKASDDSGLGLLKDLAVISELKIGATTQGSFKKDALFQDVDKLALLLDEFSREYPDSPAPLAYMCVLDNHNTKEFDYTELRAYCSASPGVQLLEGTAVARPPITPDRRITR
ncbi:hypothetical protein [Paenarthrobacter sp. YJN-5]|uniref:hypothetical protein n=1 Tax=Paenarthrobacter sp. YJN-5 TaxID=2735316 RepID=UPI0018784752|nr:hypothetical protein [Paenarthrobacter sp. YJN-5]QOT19312.1 hypothetical protein HMI59_21890 [Paenarthrobacter sp. YJN-5]